MVDAEKRGTKGSVDLASYGFSDGRVGSVWLCLSLSSSTFCFLNSITCINSAYSVTYKVHKVDGEILPGIISDM